LRVIVKHFRHGNNGRLLGSYPDGERAAKVFDKHAEKSFDTAEKCAVYHVRAFVLAVRIDKGHVKTLGFVKIKLNSGHLPLAAQSVFNFNIDLGSVKRAAAFVDLVGKPFGVYRVTQTFQSRVPFALLSDRLRRLGREVRLYLFKAENIPDHQTETKNFANLAFHLLRRTNYVRVVLCKTAHAKKPVQNARALVAVNCSKFRPAQRQIAVRMPFIVVN